MCHFLMNYYFIIGVADFSSKHFDCVKPIQTYIQLFYCIFLQCSFHTDKTADI
jgi:hypothetical protein